MVSLSDLAYLLAVSEKSWCGRRCCFGCWCQHCPLRIWWLGHSAFRHCKFLKSLNMRSSHSWLLPSGYQVSSLKKRLKAQQSDKMSSNLMGDGVARAFLKAMVALIGESCISSPFPLNPLSLSIPHPNSGGYRDALRFRPGEQITFDPDAFILSRPSYMQPFLQKMLQLQIFEQFINDRSVRLPAFSSDSCLAFSPFIYISPRLDILNAGEGFTDEFELEANLWADKWGTQSRYRDWSNNMKVLELNWRHQKMDFPCVLILYFRNKARSSNEKAKING